MGGFQYRPLGATFCPEFLSSEAAPQFFEASFRERSRKRLLSRGILMQVALRATLPNTNYGRGRSVRS